MKARYMKRETGDSAMAVSASRGLGSSLTVAVLAERAGAAFVRKTDSARFAVECEVRHISAAAWPNPHIHIPCCQQRLRTARTKLLLQRRFYLFMISGLLTVSGLTMPDPPSAAMQAAGLPAAHSSHRAMPLNHELDVLVVAADAAPALHASTSAISRVAGGGSLRFMMLSFCVSGGIAAVERRCNDNS